MARLEQGDIVPLLIATPVTVRAPAWRRAGFNLLQLRLARRLVLWVGFPYVFQAATLVVFMALALIGWGLAAPVGVPTKLYAKSNLVTLMIWGLWWPAMVWTAVLLGRAWCTVCPLELVNNISERVARRLHIRQHTLSRWTTAGWLIVGLYAFIQMCVAGASLHRSPHYTSLFLWALLGLAAVTGLLLKDRAFCRGFCPVGLLLGTYGRGGMLAVRAGGTDRCAACDERHCIRNCTRAKLDGRSCPSLLNPPKLNSNRDCLVCGQCIKACQPDNMQLVLRPPFSKHDAREPLASWPVTLFVMLASGFVTSELCSEWPAAQTWFLAVPEWLAHRVASGSATGWIEGVWTLVLVPIVLWSILAAIARFTGQSGNLLHICRRLALPLAVIIAAGHMAKGLAKFAAWAGFLPGALGSPDGVATASAIHAKSVAAPAALLHMHAVAVLSCILVCAGLIFAVREMRLAGNARTLVSAAPLMILALVFGSIIVGWA